jgi:hypothetical protein
MLEYLSISMVRRQVVKIHECRQSAGKTSVDSNPQRLYAWLPYGMKIKSELLQRCREVGRNDRPPETGRVTNLITTSFRPQRLSLSVQRLATLLTTQQLRA